MQRSPQPEHLRVKTFWRRKFGAWIDALAWRSMHAIARRQESKVPAQFPEELRSLPAEAALLFPAPPSPDQAALKNSAWKKRAGFWRRDLGFPSAMASPYPKNNFAFTRVFAGQPGEQCPAIILLHGLMNLSMLAYRPFIKAVIANGATAYALELPYHHRRTPPGSISGDLFHTADLSLTLRAVQQAVSDTRRLILLLRNAGAPGVGILGFSLGAWIGGLVACCEPELDFAFLGMPPHRLNELVWLSALGAQLRRRFTAQGWDEKSTAAFYDKLDPITYRPLLPPGQLQLYAAEFDSLIALARVQALCRAWSAPQLRVYPHGHLSIMISRQLHRDFSEDLRHRLAQLREAANANL